MQWAGSNQQCVLGQAVGGIKARSRKPAAREGIGEAMQHIRSDRLSPVNGDGPGREVKLVTGIVRDPVDAHLVGKVRAPAERALESRYRLQPATRITHERCCRHQDRRVSDDHGTNDAAHQAHVVVERQPGNTHCFRAQAVDGLSRPGIRQEILVPDHDAFGCRG